MNKAVVLSSVARVFPRGKLRRVILVYDVQNHAVAIIKSLTETGFLNTPLTIIDDGTLSVKLTK